MIEEPITCAGHEKKDLLSEAINSFGLFGLLG
jgi:hypothetical protein